VSAVRPSYAEETVARALRVLSDPHASVVDREQAAAVIGIVSRKAQLDERLASDLLNVAALWLADTQVVWLLLRTLEARSGHEGAEKLAPGVARLTARAYEEGLAASLLALVTMMKCTPEWSSMVKPGWLARALELAMVERRSHAAAASLLYASLSEREPLGPEIREVIERNPTLLGSAGLPPWLSWRLHQAAPTVRGWRVLAAKPWRGNEVPSAASFGGELDIAIETLEQAVGEQPKGAPRIVLARWLVELRGHAGEESCGC
jgi:hypothetical protein